MDKYLLNLKKMSTIAGFGMGVWGFVCLFSIAARDKWVAFSVVVGVIVVAAGFMTVVEKYMNGKEPMAVPDDNVVVNNLKEAMRKWYDDEKYGEVITFGKALGRALYISASYETRIEIGDLTRRAAENMNDNELLANVLLNDLGWTKYLCGDSSGLDDIKKGIAIAETNGFNKETSIGYRHLSAVEVEKWENPEKAQEYLDRAYEACERINEGKEKESLRGSLLFAAAELAFKGGNYEIAMEKAKECEEKRKNLNETDRHVRSYAQIGKIELFRPQGNIRDSRKAFLEGMEESESISRIDEMVKNAYGYAICSIRIGERKKAQKKTKKILKKYGKIPLYSEDEILRKRYEELIQLDQEKVINYGIY